ncbi:PREDICTED: uncharacterized protein LOC106314834 [Brassica oleracea var. oleracea]|uniref:uncharacterized protein LOC106314834 n=1 Tax=Brassica oleracea var. oleracea TaxID=109376 RepID=UPI0006A6CF4D|nr:PREDICTED: uncharacterized protein LOC106314834 [Brassica oleracea var. oleracea]
MKELLHIHKPIMLDSTNFGHWKVRMQHIIRGVDEDAWMSVEDGWSARTVVLEGKSVGQKPKDQWTDGEKKASKFNSKALTIIFSPVDVKQFKIIQGCESAKQAWDTLINHFEGNTSVRRTRLDHLASKFENLRMSDDEPIDGFICKISELASEASVLGKKYEEKDLVKKLLRYLPPRFEAYKAVLTLAVDTDEMKFDQLSGILKVHDLEKTDRQSTNQKSIAFTAESKDDGRVTKIEENLILMARNFNKFVKRMEKGYGHFRSECPLAKRKEQKCIECKGIGHTRSECPSFLKKEKSLMRFSDTESESDSDEGELHLNFMTLIGQESGKDSNAYSEDDDDLEQNLETEYKTLFDKFSDLSHENLELLKEKAMLKAQINILELDQPSTKTKAYSIDRESDQEVLALKRAMTEQERVRKEAEEHVQTLSDLLAVETDRSTLLESQLTENHKKVRMLSAGHNARLCYFRRRQYERAWRLNLCFTKPTAYGCVWIAKRDLYPNYKENTHSELNTVSVNSHTEAEHDLVCNFVRIQVHTEIVSNVAYTSAEEASQSQLPWYFDSGCSKHMTGNEDYLEKLEFIRGGKVTFGDGGQGKIRAIGITSRPDVPKLSNVYFVEGLKANLISVSQLCDDGLEVIFNSKECRAVDARNNVVLRGIRSGNNCYLWRPSNVCFTATESKLDLWHKKLGHMNTNGLSRLVNAEVVRGVPDLEKQTEIVCGACCQGKYTWVDFLRNKSDALESFRILALQLKQDKGGIIQIKSDHGGEFQNEQFDKFCHSQGIRHQYAAPRTP